MILNHIFKGYFYIINYFEILLYYSARKKSATKVISKQRCVQYQSKLIVTVSSAGYVILGSVQEMALILMPATVKMKILNCLEVPTSTSLE